MLVLGTSPVKALDFQVTPELALAARMGMDYDLGPFARRGAFGAREASYGLPQQWQSSLVLLGRQEECPRGRAIEVGLLLHCDLA